MKKIGLVLLLIWPGIVFAQTTFVATTVAFPHIVAGGDPGGINYVTLLQLVNNKSASTTGHITLFGGKCSPLGGVRGGQGPFFPVDGGLGPGATREVPFDLDWAGTAGW